MKNYKVYRCDTFEFADERAKELFVNNIPVYIFKIQELRNSANPYYIVSISTNIATSDDRTVELIKQYYPKVVKIEEVDRYYKNKNYNLYLIDSSFKVKTYYKIDDKPTLKEFIKSKYAFIKSQENCIHDISNLEVLEIESTEQFLNRNNIKMFNGDFDNVLSKLNLIKTILIKN